MTNADGAVQVPLRYPTAAIFTDESGSRATAHQFFVVAAIKLREPGRLARDIHALRQRTGFTSEFKFAEITRGSVPVYTEVLDILHASDATIAACVVCGSEFNPFTGRKDYWRVHAEVTSQLLVGCINRRELVGVHMDGITTPAEASFEDTVRAMTNSRLRNQSVISAVALDSKTNDLLQVADLVAGSILHARRDALKPATTTSHKARVSRRLALILDRPGLVNGKDARLNIATYRAPWAPREAKPQLRVVTSRNRRAG